LNLTTIGLGTWRLAAGLDVRVGAQDDKESTEAIIRAIDWDKLGRHGAGLRIGSQRRGGGKALKKFPKRPIVATKCGIVWDKNRKTSTC